MKSIYFEVASAILSLVAVFLDTQQRILARPMSLISIGIGFTAYFSSGLYAKCLLNFIYLLLNSYGWYQWKYGGKNRSGLSVSKVGAKGVIYFILLGFASTLALGYVLNTQTNADLAYWDSGNTVFCLIAHILLVRKKLETWLFWFVLDLYFTILCYYKGLYVFGAIHILYLFLAIHGYRSWYQAYLSCLATIPPTSG
ncbi:MAG: nicotinamide riboside transporter PnuC [Bacteroidota bacterium]